MAAGVTAGRGLKPLAIDDTGFSGGSGVAAGVTAGRGLKQLFPLLNLLCRLVAAGVTAGRGLKRYDTRTNFPAEPSGGRRDSRPWIETESWQP